MKIFPNCQYTVSVLCLKSGILENLKIIHDFSAPVVYNKCRIERNTLEVFTLRKLNAAVDRFACRHPRFGIPNLMRYIVGGNVLVYLLAMFSNWGAVSFLEFNLAGLLRGEVWRLVTFLFVPNTYRAFSLIISLYFYYWIGSMLEREWGTAKFSLYYLSGAALTLLTAVASSLITGSFAYSVSGAGYINLSMFFAFAMLYPDAQVLLFFFIPVKMKWLAWVDAAVFAFGAVSSLVRLDLMGALLPVIALLNFLVYFWPSLTDAVRRRGGQIRRQNSRQTIQFKNAARQQERRAREQGYRHKCSVCGRTDAEYPNLQFRYCSKCAGYHCFCEDHIFNHVHFTE